MKERARPFWWPQEVSDAASARAEIEACREWTPFLTALFDGEADEKEALVARRHLLVCERCARAWLDWNQTRHLFLQLAEPPAPPPNLLWRVRLACRLGGAPTPAPELSAQILERTSRKPARSAAPLWATRHPRLSVPTSGALAVCAFALFMGRGALGPSSPPPIPAVDSPIGAPVTFAKTENSARAETVSTEADLPILPSRVTFADAAPRLASTDPDAPRTGSGADESLLRARRELEQLPGRALPLALGASDAPLPMLPEGTLRPEKPPRRSVGRASRLARVVRVSRPVASPPRFEAPAIVLASAPAPSSELAPSPLIRAPRVLFAQFSESPLRISAPRARPITLAQPVTPDDSALDEVDSTVQEYRATLIDAPDSDGGGR